MDTLEFLQQRTSIPARYLGDPGPSDEQIQQMIRAAVAAPDHAALRPWRFILIRGDARHALADVFEKAALADDPELSADKLQRIREKPLRSPVILTVVAHITRDHPKTPPVEQMLSAGAAALQILLAANALGFGAIWLTGPNATHPMVRDALRVSGPDQIVGFLYLGTSTIKPPRPARPDINNLLEEWTGR